MTLTDTSCKNAKPKDRQYKMADVNGLYLLVKPNSRRYWRFKYRFSDKEKLLSLGVYPQISLKKARIKRDEAKKLLSENIDPSQAKQDAARTKVFEYIEVFYNKIRTHSTNNYLSPDEYEKSAKI